MIIVQDVRKRCERAAMCESKKQDRKFTAVANERQSLAIKTPATDQCVNRPHHAHDHKASHSHHGQAHGPAGAIRT